MPLRGMICPIDNQMVDKKDCLACRMSRRPRAGLPQHCNYAYEMLAGMMDSSGRARAGISATQLSSCPRQIRLMAENDYYASPNVLYPAWRGTLGHYATEAWPEPGVIYEKRFEMRVPGFTRLLTGQIDCLDIGKQRIRDFKTRKDTGMPFEPKHEHIMQLNVYRLLVTYGWPQDQFEITLPDGEEWYFPVGVPGAVVIEELSLVYWCMTHPQTFANVYEWFDAVETPSYRVVETPVPILPEEEVWDYIKNGMEHLTNPALPAIPDGWGPDSGNPICRSWCSVRALCEEKMMESVNNFDFSKGF